MRITWKREPREPGLAGVCQGERCYDLNCGGELVGHVRLKRLVRSFYFWWACSDTLGVPLYNSEVSGQEYATMEQAKADCRAYVEGWLKRREES